jgi:glycosyltransferase involved in cell wall biosynthesis
MTEWHIVTGEYPPQPGGVSDYSRLVALGLVEAGDRVHVWAPPVAADNSQVGQSEGFADGQVEIHRLPDRFGPRAMAQLHRSFKQQAKSCRILVQYVPHAFGWKGLNLPFCLWLWTRRRRESIWVMFHEVLFPELQNQSMSHRMLAKTTRLMASVVARAAERIFVSIPGWEVVLNSLVPNHVRVTWLPVPSTIPVVDDSSGVAELRARYSGGPDAVVIGHFGSYAPHITVLLEPLLRSLLQEHPDRNALLLGRGAEDFRERFVNLYSELAGSVHAVGPLSSDGISRHLSICDLMVQPFGDGVSGRRTSVMTALAHELPVMTTSGPLTESIWAESDAVALAPAEDANAQQAAAERLLNDAAERKRLSVAGATLYRERFDIRHTIAILRAEDAIPKSGAT